MSRRLKSSPSVALFPFLAVLVCTMGALIFLLLVTTRMMRDRARQRAVAVHAAPPRLPLMSVPTPKPIIPPLPDLPPPPETPPGESRDEKIRAHALAVEQRQLELNELVDQWHSRVGQLKSANDERSRLLAQRRQLNLAAQKRIAGMRTELNDLEVKLGSLTGELSAPSANTGTIQEKIRLETQIKLLKRRLQDALQAEEKSDAKEVIPFDVISGTSRRPILIECTSTGLKFIPEDIALTPADMAGFTPHVNPLLVGSIALTNYWSAWNIRQPNPSQQPEPYVLLLVRPSGTIAYYVAMKMLSDLKQPHGYELIEDDTILHMPPVDAGAKAACESAIKRLLAERNHVLRQAGAAGFGLGRGGSDGFGPSGGAAAGETGAGSGGSAVPSSGGAGAGGKAGDDGGQFELTDIMDEKDDAKGRSWERVENFEGARRGGNLPRSSAGAAAGATRPRGVPSDPTQSDAARNGAADQSAATEPGAGTVPSDGQAQSANASNSSGPRVDTGLGSSGNRSIPVEDRRGQKRKSASDRDVPAEPEQLANRHWGISEAGAVIGLERDLRVDVEATRFVIGKKHVVSIADGDSQEDTFVKMVTTLDQHAHDWGKPPQGFYWKPSLRYVIAEGGDANYERVHDMLQRAGLSSTRELASDRHDPENAKGTPEKPAKPAVVPAEPKSTRRLFRGILR